MADLDFIRCGPCNFRRKLVTIPQPDLCDSCQHNRDVIEAFHAATVTHGAGRTPAWHDAYRIYQERAGDD